MEKISKFVNIGNFLRTSGNWKKIGNLRNVRKLRKKIEKQFEFRKKKHCDFGGKIGNLKRKLEIQKNILEIWKV